MNKDNTLIKTQPARMGLLIVAIVWGSGFIVTQYAIESEVGATAITFGRFFIASLILLAVFFKDIITSKKGEILKGCLVGVFLFMGFFMQTIGQAQTKVSNSAFLTATNVVIVPFLVWAIIKKRPTGRVFLLTFTTLIGIALLTISWKDGISFGVGDVTVLISACFFALHIAYIGTKCGGISSKKIAFWQMATACVIAFVMFLFTDMKTIEVAQIKDGILPIIYLGIFPTCFCFFMQTKAQTHVAPSQAGVLLSTEGLFGSIFSVILGFEVLTVNLIVGGIIIFLSVVLIDAKPLKEMWIFKRLKKDT